RARSRTSCRVSEGAPPALPTAPIAARCRNEGPERRVHLRDWCPPVPGKAFSGVHESPVGAHKSRNRPSVLQSGLLADQRPFRRNGVQRANREQELQDGKVKDSSVFLGWLQHISGLQRNPACLGGWRRPAISYVLLRLCCGCKPPCGFLTTDLRP